MSVIAERSQELLYTISIFSQDTVLTRHGEQKEVERFVVSPDQLQSFFRVETMLVPEKGMIWMKKDANRETYLFKFPKTGRPTEIMVKRGKKVRKYSLILPNLLVMARVSGDGHKRSVKSISLWCYADGKLARNTTLYEVPLPNISRGSMCLGNVDEKVTGSVREAVWSAIFDAYFNNHHNMVGRKPMAFESYVRTLTDGVIKISGLAKWGRAGAVLEGRG